MKPLPKNVISTAVLLLCLFIETTRAQEKAIPQTDDGTQMSYHFLALITGAGSIDNSLDIIESQWSLELLPMAIETFLYTRSPKVSQRIRQLIDKETGLDSFDPNDWYQWLWSNPVKPSADYANFKANFYQFIDPRFEKYFKDRQETAQIRLDEIRWGGVRQDGIPPLRNPEMISIKKASYLADTDIVFGIEINGDARAYPKRILAWHEMFTDEIGGVSIAGVYCTLCGTVIPYRTEHQGTNYQLGTSGFLYRSNKLMYDKATQSLWSTERGEPVLGPLVNKGIALSYESVVTTTWGEWKTRHPDTTVLSLNTGHRRNYDEGFAYADYFSTDELMFITPFNDDRLKNKQEVLALRFAAAPNEQLAIDTDFLIENSLYKNKIGKQSFVVFTDTSGANRVFDPKGINFVSYDGFREAKDDSGQVWQVEEEWLENKLGQRLNRLPYHRAFWFGWHAAFPETQLIK